MPGRIVPLVTDQIYHVFNRGIDGRPTFVGKRECDRARALIPYYRYKKPPVRYSIYLRWMVERKQEFLREMNLTDITLVDILAYCLMPNHFHFLLRQTTDGGISKFMSNFQNSYTRFVNTKHKRVGPLFLNQFKAVRIEDDEQYIHVARYIHLNPYTSYMVTTIDELKRYPWSSLPEYITGEPGICEKNLLLGLFTSKSEFTKFTFDQAQYQRQLGKIKHLMLEEEMLKVG